MIDLILFVVILGAFLGGIYCGSKFGSTIIEMFTRIRTTLVEWFR